MERPRIYSFTSLERYATCSEMFRLYHYDKSVPRPDTTNEEGVAGDICHDVLEVFYLDQNWKVPLALEAHWVTLLDSLGCLPLLGNLKSIFEIYQKLMHKASADYDGRDAIRTPSGNISKSPRKTSAWKRQADAWGLTAKMQTVDKIAAKLNSQIPEKNRGPWGGVSLSAVYCETWWILGSYKDTMQGFTIVDLEFPFTDIKDDVIHNAAVYPNVGELFKGFIDVVAYAPDGRLILVDHKTAKDCPTADKVAHHEQLLKYGYFWRQLTGQVPGWIAINHLRSSSLVMAPFQMKLAEAVMNIYEGRIVQIKQKNFHKHKPTERQSPCTNQYGQPCGYLKHCWPSHGG